MFFFFQAEDGIRDLTVTGVQTCALPILYPVEDPKTLSDKRGNVLPDVYLTPKGYVAKDLAMEIHSDLAKRMLHAIDARNGLRLPQDYQLRDRDIISIVTAARKK